MEELYKKSYHHKNLSNFIQNEIFKNDQVLYQEYKEIFHVLNDKLNNNLAIAVDLIHTISHQINHLHYYTIGCSNNNYTYAMNLLLLILTGLSYYIHIDYLCCNKNMKQFYQSIARQYKYHSSGKKYQIIAIGHSIELNSSLLLKDDQQNQPIINSEYLSDLYQFKFINVNNTNDLIDTIAEKKFKKKKFFFFEKKKKSKKKILKKKKLK